MGRGSWWLVAGISTAVVVLVGWRGAALSANLTRAAIVKDLAANGELRNGNEATWDDGWHTLCNSNVAPVSAAHTNLQPETLSSFVQAQIDLGRYDAALVALDRATAEGWLDEVYNAPAYHAALQLNWREAAKQYQPERTPRLQRWWGTIFYLAAQQQWFAGRSAEAAPFYRQADALYGSQGPYLGLALVDCLKEQNRLTEAWDAYRRGLVVLPVEEALAHVKDFEALRLRALEQWQARDPQNEQVTAWLKFYETTDSTDRTEIWSNEPNLQVKLAADLSQGKKMIGFDYRVEDIETGPFMTVDFYVRDSAHDGDRILQERRTVLNQAPNGAFTWDAVPDGIRPVGWHRFVYSTDSIALEYIDLFEDGRWMCLDGERIHQPFGFHSYQTPPRSEALYISGNRFFVERGGRLAHVRSWLEAGVNQLDALAGGMLQEQAAQMMGAWRVPAHTDWIEARLYSLPQGRACARDVFVVALPDK